MAVVNNMKEMEITKQVHILTIDANTTIGSVHLFFKK